MRRVLPLLLVVASACQGESSGTGDDAGFGGRYHPADFAAADVHGPATKQGGMDCRGCHGYELTGTATAPSCDGCHLEGEDPTAWRQRCTFCHGGELDDTGAPPRDLSGAAERFPAHTAHVNQGVAAAADCIQCHVKAVDVLSPGHIFDDDTPGVAEVDLGAGLSPQGSFAGETCSNLYCHGSGRGEDGQIATDAGKQTCTSCHAGATSGPAELALMSGAHGAHLAVDSVACATCHPGVSVDGKRITEPATHVDGARDVVIDEPGFAFDRLDKTCTGSCHGFAHAGTGWTGAGGVYHPAGFDAPAMHGTEMELQRQDCRGCHGADLTGGTAQTCDNCHASGWREDCTFCHGGGLNDTGAPPRDLGSGNLTVSQSFVAHTSHVTQGVSRASDCGECHRKPTDVMSAGHAFDDTPGTAELDFSGGRSPAAVYNGNGGCSGLYCHGNGRGDNGVATDGMAKPTCAGCHPDFTTRDRWDSMGGDHKKHLEEGYNCQECHRDVTADGASVIAPLLHIDRARAVRFLVDTITYDPATRRCTGPCHGENHSDTW